MAIAFDPSKIDPVIRERWEADGKQIPYVNNLTSKGPVYIVDNSGNFWAAVVDVKTKGYRYLFAVARCINGGGNYDDPKLLTPLDLMKAEIEEELDNREVSQALADSVVPIGEYFKIGEQRAHGHKEMGTVRIHDSIFASTIEMGALFEALKLPRELQNHKALEEYLTRISPQNARRVFSYSELNTGVPRVLVECIERVPFAWGDGVEFVDATKKLHGFVPVLETDEEGMTVLKLSTNPLTRYTERLDLLEITIRNPFKKKLADGDALQLDKK